MNRGPYFVVRDYYSQVEFNVYVCVCMYIYQMIIIKTTKKKKILTFVGCFMFFLHRFNFYIMAFGEYCIQTQKP